ncbi:MAG: MarR family transcriptional regulator [Planctomycetota bacterium]|nr:MAG: MarR family transcriptional regulator [Planctomycetota bacterium]
MKLKKDTDLPVAFRDKAHEALVSIYWTGTLLRKAFGKVFRPQLRSEAQFNILMILSRTGEPLTQTDLSRMLFVDKSNVTGLIDGLEKNGLLKRNRVEGDRRSYHITLTPKGQSLIQKMEKRYREKVSQVMSAFSSREHALLSRLTLKVREGLK